MCTVQPMQGWPNPTTRMPCSPVLLCPLSVSQKNLDGDFLDTKRAIRDLLVSKWLDCWGLFRFFSLTFVVDFFKFWFLLESFGFLRKYFCFFPDKKASSWIFVLSEITLFYHSSNHKSDRFAVQCSERIDSTTLSIGQCVWGGGRRGGGGGGGSQIKKPWEHDDENDEYDYDNGNAAYNDALMSSMTIPKIFNYHDLTLWSK